MRPPKAFSPPRIEWRGSDEYAESWVSCKNVGSQNHWKTLFLLHGGRARDDLVGTVSYKAVGELNASPPVVFDYAAPPGFGTIREKWDKTVKVRWAWVGVRWGGAGRFTYQY